MAYKYETLFSADERLTDGWIEHSIQGTNTIYNELSNIMPLNCKPTILQVMEAVCSSDISGNSKVFFLESIACDLSVIAIARFKRINKLKSHFTRGYW